ncbi:aspartate/glutamate racemase family protein [Shouchella clausii]|uniref:aspartate/glutamate racemase family protein n=1 Tax=Shouchella clausii TaxID=79880 RepID=UPI002148D5A1|nr:aspartate/glutamate racemase family protein [Shouchella clausii]MCR1287357.1 aspartate/glutamate racemase family protein [Shouchella clausii]
MLGIVRVWTTEDEQLLQEHSVLLRQRMGIHSISDCIPDQPYGIYNQESKAAALPKITALVKEMAADADIDAISISCAADPALDVSRAAVSIPVIGAGEAGAHAACMISDKIGVLGLTNKIPEAIETVLGERLVGHLVPDGVTNTTDLLKKETTAAAISSARQLINQGATAILFACTGYSTIHLKETIIKELAVPVIDLVEAQGMAYSMIRQRR